MNDEQELKILSFTSEAVRANIESDEPVMALKVIMLVQYMDESGTVFDGYMHAGEPRYTEVLGALDTHRMRMHRWYEDVGDSDE